jgi:hypothetical protein
MIHPISAAEWTYVLNLAAAQVRGRQLLETDRAHATEQIAHYRNVVAALGPSFKDRAKGLEETALRWAGEYLRDPESVPRLGKLLASQIESEHVIAEPKRRSRARRSENT